MAANPFTAERERRQSPNPFAAERQRREGSDDWGGAYSTSMFDRFVKNVLSAPRAAGDLLAGGAALVEGGASKIGGGDFDFDRRYAEQQQKFPASALRAVPEPSVEDVAAGRQTFGAAARSIPSLVPGGETPQDAFARNRSQMVAEDERDRAQHPFATAAGDVSGDIATLVTGRAPIANLVRSAERKLLPKAADMPAISQDPGFGRAFERALKSEPVRRIARGAGRSVETGLEASVMEVLKGENADPLEAAAFAAGGQVIGSSLLEGGRGLLSGGPTKAGIKISLAAASIAGMWQLGKAATPGGRDRILESIETGYDKVAYGLMLGAAAAMSGAGRGRSGKFSEDMPVVADAIASVPRGAALSLITDIAKADEATRADMERALAGLSRDPNYKGSNEAEKRVIARIKAGVNE